MDQTAMVRATPGRSHGAPSPKLGRSTARSRHRPAKRDKRALRKNSPARGGAARVVRRETRPLERG